MAHRCIEWDGWEEGLVESMLGPPEQEDDWFRSWDGGDEDEDADAEVPGGAETPPSPFTSTSPTLTESVSDSEESAKRASLNSGGKAKGGRAPALPAKVVALEKEKEKALNATGDFCGGRGGELGRRLEAWLCVNGDSEGRIELARRWAGDVEDRVFDA